MSQPKQNLQNHVRYEPLYHFVLVGLVTVLLVHAVTQLKTGATMDKFFTLGIVVALLLLVWFARAFALKAQDRVIRLEMRLRLQALAPALAARFSEFPMSMLTALRFAGDGELPQLAQQVLDGTITSSGEVKKRITDWQADHQRV